MSNIDDYEKAAAGMDLEEGENRPSSVGDALVSGGPGLFDEIENLLPEKWRDHIVHFPLTALTLAFGVGVFLGAKKGDELIATGSAMISAAAASNLSEILGGNLD